MGTLFKILKALNSAISEKQLSIAVILGMINGFLPIVSILSIFILIIVFIFNIPVGIFLLSMAFFSSLGFVLDPLFSQVGLTVLTNDSLNAIFTSWYNNPVILWTDFNYTTTLGSLIIAFVVTFPLYFILNKIFIKYRQTLQSIFENSKFFSWLNPYNEDNLKNKQGIFRVSGLIIISSFIGIIVAFIIVLFDPIVKYILTKSINENTDYKVQINNLNTSFNNGNIQLKNIVLVKNNQTTKVDKVVCDIDSQKLLKKQLHIKLLDINGIKFIQKAVKIKQQKDYIKIPSFKNIQEIQTVNFNDNINTVATDKIQNFIDNINKALEKIKPYLQSQDKQVDIKKERTVGQYVLFKSYDNKAVIQVDKIKANGNIEKELIPLGKKLALKNSLISFQIDIDSKDIDDIKSNNNLQFDKTNIKFNASNKNEQIVADILNEIDKFYIKGEINLSLNNTENIDFHIKSNLDKILKEKFKTRFEKELKKKIKKKIEKKIQEKIKDKAGEKIQNLFKKFL